MDEKLERRMLRMNYSPLGWALFVYLLILNACVLVFAIVDMVVIAFSQLNGGTHTEEELSNILMQNGWGYMVSIAVGLIALRLWKGKKFFRETLWTKGKPMQAGDFFCLLALFLAGQLAFSLIAEAMEAFFNLFGLSVLDSIESATMSADSFSMFLYAGIGAPIAEEILFRGLVLRHLEPYGKRFAIVMSAFAFAVFHGNLVQIPYAFLVGLILGYTAVEHNILWAIVLHMINNLVLADMVSRICSYFPPFVEELAMLLIIWGSAVAAVVILIVKRKQVAQYFKGPKMHPLCLKCFITSPGILVFTGWMIANILLGLLLSLA